MDGNQTPAGFISRPFQLLTALGSGQVENTEIINIQTALGLMSSSEVFASFRN